MLDAFVVEGEKVTVEGWLTFYDENEKSWKPLDGILTFYLDGREIGSTEARYGQFSYTFPSPVIGKHKIDIKFKAEGYEMSHKSLSFEVVPMEKKKRIIRFAKIIFILILLLCATLLLSVFLVRLL
ncbi:MAG: hypothetical protein QXR27_05450 [Archaeoglobaceae archaeon]